MRLYGASHTSPYSTALSIAGSSSPYFLIRSVLQRVVQACVVQAYMADTRSMYVYGLRVWLSRVHLTLLLIFTSSYAYISHVSAVIANVNYIYIIFDV